MMTMMTMKTTTTTMMMMKTTMMMIHRLNELLPPRAILPLFLEASLAMRQSSSDACSQTQAWHSTATFEASLCRWCRSWCWSCKAE
jgi:hypothetical protein